MEVASLILLWVEMKVTVGCLVCTKVLRMQNCAGYKRHCSFGLLLLLIILSRPDNPQKIAIIAGAAAGGAVILALAIFGIVKVSGGGKKTIKKGK